MIFSGLMVKSRLKKALDLLNCGMYSQAATELKGILHALREKHKDDQKRASVLFYLAECFIAMGDEKCDDKNFQGALSDYQEAVDLDVNFPDLHFRIGQVRMTLGELDQAEKALDKAIALNPHYVKARLLLADLHSRKGSTDLAIEEYARLHEQGVLCDEERYRIGMRHVDEGESQKGYEIIRESFEEKPDPVQALYLKGKRCYQNKDYKGAVEHLRKVMEEHSDYPDIFNFLGVAYCGDKCYVEAEEAFRRAVELNQHYLEPRLNLAFLYERLEQREKAAQVFREVIHLEPENVIALEGLKSLEQG
jgi:tetratricopeptide (TPR) repeat protein